MKVSKANLIEDQGPFLSFYIPKVSSLDVPASRLKKVGNSIDVNPDNATANTITIRFVINAIVAVADETPDAKVLAEALTKLGVAAAGLADAGTATIIVNGLTASGDAASIGNKLYKSGSESRNIQFIVPVEETKSNCKYNITSRTMGTTVTSDTGKKNEKAKITTDLRWRQTRTKKVKTENFGLEDSKSFDHMQALSNMKGNDGTVDLALTASFLTKTNGAVWHDTISGVKIDLVEIIIEEICGSEEKVEEEDEKPKEDKDEETKEGKEQEEKSEKSDKTETKNNKGKDKSKSKSKADDKTDTANS